MSEEKLIYREPERLSKKKILKMLQSNDVSEIENALVSLALFEKDFIFAKNIIYKYAQSSDKAIKGVAILCIGHLARIHEYLPDHPTLEIIEAGLKDTNDYVRAQSESAASDITIFIPNLGKRIQGRIMPEINLDD